MTDAKEAKPILDSLLQIAKKKSVDVSDSNNYETENQQIRNKLAIGDIVSFGKYEQKSNKGQSESLPIEWIVLKKEKNKALLLSRFVLDERGFDEKEYFYSSKSTDWARCTLRSWLNGELLANAFSQEEKEVILIVKNKNKPAENNIKKITYNTRERIFLLSSEEFSMYIKDSDLRFGYSKKEYIDIMAHISSEQTRYTCSNESNTSLLWSYGYNHSTKLGDHSVKWWLRTPNICINSYGELHFDKYLHGRESKLYIRPCMWINMDNTYADKLIQVLER